MGTVVFFREVKRPERFVDYSRLSNSEVTNEWSYTSAPPLCVHGVDRNSFTFIVYYYGDHMAGGNVTDVDYTKCRTVVKNTTLKALAYIRAVVIILKGILKR
jgi:hypothetical protein